MFRYQHWKTSPVVCFHWVNDKIVGEKPSAVSCVAAFCLRRNTSQCLLTIFNFCTAVCFPFIRTCAAFWRYALGMAPGCYTASCPPSVYLYPVGTCVPLVAWGYVNCNGLRIISLFCPDRVRLAFKVQCASLSPFRCWSQSAFKPAMNSARQSKRASSAETFSRSEVSCSPNQLRTGCVSKPALCRPSWTYRHAAGGAKLWA